MAVDAKDAGCSQRGVLERGVHFIQKPFSSTTLGRRVREALEG